MIIVLYLYKLNLSPLFAIEVVELFPRNFEILIDYVLDLLYRFILENISKQI